MFTSDLTAVFYVLLAVVVVFYCVSLVLLLLRYHSQPLPFRCPPLLLLTLLGCAVSSVWVTLLLIFTADGLEASHDVICSEWWDWLLWTADLCIVLPYALRAYRIFRIFTSRSAPLSASSTLNGHSLNSPSLSSHKPPSVITSLHLLLVFACAFVVLSVLKLALNLNGISTSHGFGCPHSSTEVWEAVSVLEVALLLFAVRRLRQVRQEIRDDYGMMREFVLVAVVWTSYWLATVGLGVVRDGSLVHSWSHVNYSMSLYLYRYVHTPVLLLRNVLIAGISCLYPLYLSSHHTFTPLWSSPDSLLSLDSLLKDIICIQYYRQFLISIEHVEWVLCWVEIELWKDLCDLPPAQQQQHHALAPHGTAAAASSSSSLLSSSAAHSDLSPPLLDSHPSPSSSSSARYTAKQQQMITDEAHRIYDKYLVPSAPMHVQLSALVLHRVGRELSADSGVSSDCFDEVQGELYMKMNAEFARFLSSPLCEQCLEELEREEQLRETLEKSGMI